MRYRLKVNNQYIKYDGKLTRDKNKSHIHHTWQKAIIYRDYYRDKYSSVRIESF